MTAKAMATGLLLFGGLLAVLNLCNVLYSWRTGRFRSRVPLLGALFGIAGCMVYPPLRPYAWLPVVLDVGTLELLWCLPAIVRRERQYARSRLQAEYRLAEPDRCVTLSLFKGGHCILRMRLAPIPNEREPFEGSLVGAWTRPAGKLLHLDMEAVSPAAFEFEIEQGGALRCIHAAAPWPVDDLCAQLAGTRLIPVDPASALSPE